MSMGHGKRADRINLDDPFREARRPIPRRMIRAVALSTTTLATDWSDADPLVVLKQSGGQVIEALS